MPNGDIAFDDIVYDFVFELASIMEVKCLDVGPEGENLNVILSFELCKDLVNHSETMLHAYWRNR